MEDVWHANLTCSGASQYSREDILSVDISDPAWPDCILLYVLVFQIQHDQIVSYVWQLKNNTEDWTCLLCDLSVHYTVQGDNTSRRISSSFNIDHYVVGIHFYMTLSGYWRAANTLIYADCHINPHRTLHPLGLTSTPHRTLHPLGLTSTPHRTLHPLGLKEMLPKLKSVCLWMCFVRERWLFCVFILCVYFMCLFYVFILCVYSVCDVPSDAVRDS